MYQISADLVNGELRNTNFEGKNTNPHAPIPKPDRYFPGWLAPDQVKIVRRLLQREETLTKGEAAAQRKVGKNRRRRRVRAQRSERSHFA